MILCGGDRWSLARCVYTGLSRPYKEVHYAAWQKAWGCGFLHKEGVLFGLQGCLSTATLHRPWLPVSAAVASLAGSRRGASGGRHVARCVLAAVVRVGESSHRLALAKPLIFLAGGDVAAGTGEEHRRDLGSPEEEPVVARLPELCPSWDGRWDAGEACEELGKVVRARMGCPHCPCLSGHCCVSAITTAHRSLLFNGGDLLFVGRGSPQQIYFSDHQGAADLRSM